MESHGHMNTRTDYTKERIPGEGYYSLHSNNKEESHITSPWPQSDDGAVYKSPAEDETERVSNLHPRAYQFRANNNFFGGRTAFYTQLNSELNEKEGITLSVEQKPATYNSAAGLWMEPTMV